MRLGTRPLPEPAEASELDVERSISVEWIASPAEHSSSAGGPVALPALPPRKGGRAYRTRSRRVSGHRANVEYRGYRFDIVCHRFFTISRPSKRGGATARR